MVEAIGRPELLGKGNGSTVGFAILAAFSRKFWVESAVVASVGRGEGSIIVGLEDCSAVVSVLGKLSSWKAAIRALLLSVATNSAAVAAGAMDASAVGIELGCVSDGLSSVFVGSRVADVAAIASLMILSRWRGLLSGVSKGALLGAKSEEVLGYNLVRVRDGKAVAVMVAVGF